MTLDADVVVVGAGIVGLATARALQRQAPPTRVLVVEKEVAPGRHQSGRNSGVVHAGVYYRPGSRKAELCLRGREALRRYCDDTAIPFRVCGKLVVATSAEELPALAALQERCAANGVTADRLDPAGIRRVEPYASGVAALHVPSSAVVDFRAVTAALASDVVSAGGELRTGVRVSGGAAESAQVTIETTAGTLRAGALVNCAGLHADRVAALLGAEPAVRLLPFRGEYYDFTPHAAAMVRALIYPVPDPRFPFLGVHATRSVDGHVHAGPSAVLALSREGYRWRDVDAGDLREMVRYPGLWRLARRYWRTGGAEVWRSVSKQAFARALRRLLPAVRPADLVPAPAGVRAQAVDASGELVDDFVFQHDHPRVLHVLNAPSPAATASLAIGQAVAARLRAGVA